MSLAEGAMDAGALAVARAVVSGDVTAGEMVHLALERVEADNDRIAAVVELRAAEALEQAGRIDCDGPAGPLCGVPITIKEAVHVAGMRSTWGLPQATKHVASEDAAVVARLRQAGAIVIGTTNVHEMLTDFGQTNNPLYGRTRNPRDPTRTPGGSSGGAAAAVAAGFSCLDIGSDLVGSVRFPAAYCGVCGLRPSFGLVPLEGFSPPGAPQLPSRAAYLSTLGPIARRVEDLQAALELITAVPLESARHAQLRDFRVGMVLDDPALPTSHETLAVLGGVIEALEAAGVAVVPGWPEGVDPSRDFEAFGRHLQAFFAATAPDGDLDDLLALRDAPDRAQARAAWARHFEIVDVFLCPIAPTTAPEHDTRDFLKRTVETTDGPVAYSRLPFWVAQATLSGLPAATIPAGTASDGLPVGLQIIGAQDEDSTVLAFAESLTDYIHARE